MALNIDGIEEAIKQSPRRSNVTERGDQDELIDETTDHLNKISDYKSYCKVGKMAELLSYTITIILYSISIQCIFPNQGSDGHCSPHSQRQSTPKLPGALHSLQIPPRHPLRFPHPAPRILLPPHRRRRWPAGEVTFFLYYYVPKST